MKFQNLFDLYIECHLKPTSSRWKSNVQIFHNHMKIWMDREAEEIKKYEVLQWRAKLNEQYSPHTANRTHQLFRAVFNWGISAEAIKCQNPAAKLGRFKETSRERFLQSHELEPFESAVNSLPNRNVQDFFYMLLFTSARKTNVLSMRWCEVDMENAIWTIPKTKNGDSLRVPLIDEAMIILRRRHLESACEWVFPSDKKIGDRLKCPDKSWKKVVMQANLEDFRMHDLRRTLPSHQAINGVGLTIIGASLGHRDIKSTTIYAKLGSVEPVRRAMKAANQHLMAIRGPVLAGQFVQEAS